MVISSGLIYSRNFVLEHGLIDAGKLFLSSFPRLATLAIKCWGVWGPERYYCRGASDVLERIQWSTWRSSAHRCVFEMIVLHELLSFKHKDTASLLGNGMDDVMGLASEHLKYIFAWSRLAQSQVRQVVFSMRQGIILMLLLMSVKVQQTFPSLGVPLMSVCRSIIVRCRDNPLVV